MQLSRAAAFLLFCILLSLHACNCRILLAKYFDHEQALGPDPESVMDEISMESKLQDSEIVSATDALWAMTAEHPVLPHKGRSADAGSRDQSTRTGIRKIEERRLQDKAAAAQEIDANDPESDAAQDAVVMDYAHPHRKPPIHNEEN